MSKKDPFLKFGLLEQSLKYAFDNCMPLISTIELTDKCNLSCSHCYNYDRTSLKESPISAEAMTDIEIESVIKDLAELGALFINFSGGEALLHPSIVKFVKLAKSLHMEPRLKTNGILLKDILVNDLYESGLNSADISLYGADSETYEKLTGNKHGLKHTIEGIEKLRDIGVDVHVSIILQRDNVSQLSEMIKICQDLKVHHQTSTEVTERYDGSKGSRNNEITVDQFQELLQGPHGEIFNYHNENNGLQCSCARSVCGISFTGDVYPCIGAPIFSGNVKKDGLINIWKNSTELNKIRGIKKKDFKECGECEYIKSCNRSSGSIYINTGDYMGCEESTYKQAKITHELKK